ncbi:MAG: hypothetical protein ACLUG4_04915 [Bacilli bacterium]
MNNNQEQRTLNNLKKNKPSIVLPIINTVFSVIFLAGSIYCKIAFKEQYALGYFIAFNILVILFPITSWYNSYFSKNKILKKLITMIVKLRKLFLILKDYNHLKVLN